MADVDQNIKDVILAWLRVSPKKMLIVTLCGIFSYLGWYVRDEVKLFVHLLVERYADNSYNQQLPRSTITSTSKVEINNILRNFISKHDYIGATVLYEFVPKGSEILYQGRVAVASISHSGIDIVQRYNSEWLPMNVNRLLIEKILRGNNFIQPEKLEDDIDNVVNPDTLNYHLVKQDGYEMVISVPVIDATNQVRGYVTTFVTKKPANQDGLLQYQTEINRLTIELSRFFAE